MKWGMAIMKLGSDFVRNLELPVAAAVLLAMSARGRGNVQAAAPSVPAPLVTVVRASVPRSFS